jgi:hypothetical protein
MSEIDKVEAEVLWGAPAIAQFLGLTLNQAYYALETGKLPARKTGKIWTATPRALRRHWEVA